MGKKAGKIVMTKLGIGHTYNHMEPVNGKIPVYLVNEDCSHKKDDKGNEIRLLIKPENLQPIGFHD